MLAALTLAGCSDGGKQAGSPRYTNCKRVDLRDMNSGTLIRGAEDLVFDPRYNRILVSAYDRWATEKAVKNKAPQLPNGGLYAIALTPGWTKGTELAARKLTRGAAEGRSFHPHGIDLLDIPNKHAVLAVINREYLKSGPEPDAAWTKKVSLEVYRIKNNRLIEAGRIGTPDLCRANDVKVIDPTTFAVTTDRSACSGAAVFWENLFRVKGGALRKATLGGKAGITLNTQLSGIGFANGVAAGIAPNMDNSGMDQATTFWIAGTRERSLIEFVETRHRRPFRDNPEDALEIRTDTKRHPLFAAPDNITMTPDDTLIIAAHASLFRLARYRFKWGWTSRAPSLIVEWDPKTQTTQTLFEDKSGKTFSAATTALRIRGTLVAGSVADSGLLICPHTLEGGGS